MKKRILVKCIWLLVIGLVVWGVITFFRKYPLKRTDFSSLQEFCQAGWLHMPYHELPENAEDVHYYLSSAFYFVEARMYSFSLPDDADYDDYMEKIKQYSCTDIEHSCGWEDYELYQGAYFHFSEEELRRMDYLVDNYENMSYQEILSYDILPGGFAHGYGADVEDFWDLEYTLGEFPKGLSFEEVIPDDVRSYTILYYHPSGTGSMDYGILVNEAEHRFLIYYGGTIK
ncbi:MAG: hypothetical protein K2O32_14560 [Acetatifactor sp.]|nr:hypothetical protein [Acetatifactor sp.]